MKQFLVAFLAAVGAVALGLIALMLVATLLLLAPEPLPRDIVLEVDLEKGMVERVPDDPFALYLERDRLVLRDVVEAFERARDDERVRGLVVRVAAGGVGLGRVEEIREAVARFRESGKPTILFSETFGELSPGFGGYHLASAFDEVVLQPSGDLNVAGLSVDEPFFRGTLDLLDMEPRLDHREEYKTGRNTFTEDSYTDPHREASQALIVSFYDEIVHGVADARGLDPEAVRDLFSRGPFVASEALEEGLVDRLAYRDELVDGLREELGGDVEFVEATRYLERAGRPHVRGPDVALIHASGAILRGRSGYDPVMGEAVAGAETITEAFREAVEDEEVEAILFRVDSPGGSAVASDAIRRAVERARAAGVPVVVSMGNAAASGGYMISAGADRIVAHPSTLTGSIGVWAGKVVTTGLWERMGVTWDHVEVGDNAGMWSPVRDYSPQEWERLQHLLDRVYDDFVEGVADGREMTRSDVLEVAGGRVWTGRDALERGLVDELGGFHHALEAVRRELGLEPDEPVELRVLPRERTLLELVMAEGWVQGALSAGSAGAAAARAMEALRPLAVAARRAGLVERPGPLAAPEPSLPFDR